MILRELIAKFGVKVDKGSVATANGVVGDLKKAAQTMIGLWAGSRIVGALRGIVNDVVQMGDELDRTAQKLGMNTGAVQGLAHAAELSNVSMDEVSASMRIVSRNAYEAANGSKAQADGFRALGVSVKNANGTLKGGEQLFYDTVDALNKMPASTKKTALQMELLGRSSAQMAPLIAMGSKGIKAMAAEVDELGARMSKGVIEQATRLDDNFVRLNRVIESVKIAIAAKLMPAVSGIIEKFTDWWKINKDWARQKIWEAIDMMSHALQAVWTTAKVVGEGLGQLGQLLYDLVGPVGTLAVAFALLVGVLGWPAALLILMVALVEDFVVWTEDGDSALGDLLGSFKDFKGAWSEFMKDVDTNGWWSSLKDIFKTAIDFWKGDIKDFASWIKSFLPIMSIVSPSLGQSSAMEAQLREMARPMQSLTPEAQARVERVSQNNKNSTINQTNHITINGVPDAVSIVPQLEATIAGRTAKAAAVLP
jgi:hypothetical protein